jgi:hypothetical protein
MLAGEEHPTSIKEMVIKMKEVQRQSFHISKETRELFSQLTYDYVLIRSILENKKKKTEQLVRIYLGVMDENIPLDTDLFKKINMPSKFDDLLKRHEKYSDLCEILIGNPSRWLFCKMAYD